MLDARLDPGEAALTGAGKDRGRRRRRCRVGLEVLEDRCVPSTAAALAISAEVSSSSLAGSSGMVLGTQALIIGQTGPGARVFLEQGVTGRVLATARAGADGQYHARLTLPVGHLPLHIVALDRQGEIASVDLTVTRGDALLAWNATALNAVRTGASNPPLAARNLAMVQLAVFDAVNSIEPHYQAYFAIQARAPKGASEVAAIAGAAAEVLTALYPQQASTFTAMLAATESTVPGRLARMQGELLGRQIGDRILALRANDGANTFVDAPPATKPGDWSPTPPAFGQPVGLNFAFVTPFAMTSPSQFRPGPPPALDSAQYAAAYNEVMAVGSVNSTVRTADQTAYARFWADLVGSTFTPAGHWNQIAEDAAMTRRMSLSAEAHLFGLLDIALADAGISCWETKNFYDAWRPVTAIRAGNGGIGGLAADPSWTPLWTTPSFSSYTSGHATFSAAAAQVLDSVFGSNFAFTDHGEPTENLPARHFASFDQAAAEAAASRMYGGIHFRFDNETGLVVGTEVGQYVVQHELGPQRLGSPP